MIYLPKPFERYLSALRLFLQIRLISKGQTVKKLQQLKKISLAEAYYYKAVKTPTDIIKLSASLLGASSLILLKKECNLDFSLNGNGNYIINKRLFTIALMEAVNNLIEKEGKISVTAQKKLIIMKINSLKFTKRLKKIIKELNGYYFFEKKSDYLIIVIPSERTELNSESIENEWYYILDRFSPVNIWLLNVVD